MLINNQNYLHGRLVGIGKIRKDGSREFRFLEKPINNMILRCGLNEFMTYNGSNSATLQPTYDAETGGVFDVVRYCGFGTGNQSNNFADTNSLQIPSINPYSTREARDWPFNGLFCGNNGTDDSYKIRLSHKSQAVTESIAVREIGYFKNYNSANHLFSRIVLPSPFQLDAGDQLITTYELVVSFARTPINITNCGLHDSSDNELGCQIAERYISSATSGYLIYPYNNTYGYTTALGVSGRVYLHAPFEFYNFSQDHNTTAQGRFTLRYTKNSFDFPNTSIPQFSWRSYSDGDKCTNQSVNNVTDSFHRDIVVNAPAYWPEMTNITNHMDIYAINWGALYVRFGHFDANMDFTPAPWRKLASRTAKFVFRQSIATQDSIEWQQSQQP